MSKLTSVVIVGSGITGLLTAYLAASEKGHSVCLLSKSPHPQHKASSYESSTWDGWVNRYITLTEGHPYLDLPGYINTMYPQIDQDFLTPVIQGGMLALPLSQWDANAEAFLKERYQANQNREATLQCFQEYLDENRSSLELWYRFLTIAIESQPDLLDSLSLHCQGIDRFYDQVDLFDEALNSQQRQQIVKSFTLADELQSDKAFGNYCSNSFIKGGAITVYGLAFNVQAIGRWLLDRLKALGADLRLGAEYEVMAIEKNSSEQIVGLRTRNGELYAARHIVLHPGAYMLPQVLEGTPAYGRLAGVKGLWLRIRNAQNLFGNPPRPNKIHGSRYPIHLHNQTYCGQIVDINIMPQIHADGAWDLIVGSGYLFVGLYPFQGNDNALADELVLQAFVAVVEQIYNLSIDIDRVMAGTHEYIDLPSKGCIRSWSPDDRELRVILPTSEGGVMLIEGGGNTGSTSKALFGSRVALEFIDSIDAGAEITTEHYESIRARYRRSNTDLTTAHWQQLEDSMVQAIETAKFLSNK